jgi:hypothetical protein
MVIDDKAIAINALISAVEAIQRELGITPSGVYADTRVRLDILEARINNPLAPAPSVDNPFFIGTDGITISTGDGYPTENRLSGSLYLRQDGYAYEGLYQVRPDMQWHRIDTDPWTAFGDLSGNIYSQTVIGLQNRPFSNAAPSNTLAGDGYVISWNSILSQWEPQVGFYASGDLTGTKNFQTISYLQGTPINIGTLTVNHDGYALIWDNNIPQWQPQKLAVIFDTANSTNIKSNRYLTQSNINNTKQGIVNFGSDTSQSTLGAQEDFCSILSGDKNTAAGIYSSVVSGLMNTASDGYSSILGGYSNIASNTFSAIINGISNIVNADKAIIINGQNNNNLSNYGFIGNGYANYVSGNYATIVNGQSNSILGNYANILGGETQSINADYSSITSGSNNFIESNLCDILGGTNNSIYGSGNFAFILSGQKNTVTTANNSYNGIITGDLNNLDGYHNIIVAGFNNNLSGHYNILLNGSNNTCSNSINSLLIGTNNLLSANYAFIHGSNNQVNAANFISVNGDSNILNNVDYCINYGSNNTVYDGYNIIIGFNNTVSSSYSSVFGELNTTESQYNITCGDQNNINAEYSYIIGSNNTINSNYSSICGFNNTADGYHSYIMGNNNDIDGYHSHILGNNNESSANYNYIFGNDGYSRIDGQFVISSAKINSNIGSAQYSNIIIQGSQISGGQFDLTTKDNKNLTFEDGKSYDICLRVLINNTTGTPTCARYIIDILAHCESGILILDASNITLSNVNGTGWTVSLLPSNNELIVRIDSSGVLNRRSIATVEWRELSRL